MSRKNSKENKQLRRLARAINKDPLPSRIDLVEWLKVRGFADTTGGALKIIMADRVVVDDIPIGKGIVQDAKGNDIQVIERFVSSHLRGSILVSDLEGV